MNAPEYLSIHCSNCHSSHYEKSLCGKIMEKISRHIREQNMNDWHSKKEEKCLWLRSTNLKGRVDDHSSLTLTQLN